MADLASIVTAVLSIIGGATVLLRVIAPYTKTKTDDHVARYLEKFLESVALDSKAIDGNYLRIKLSNK